jgi:hypothetical protein
MAEATTSAAVCVATGATMTSFCAAFGFDPMLLAGGAAGGAIGCVIARSLLPSKGDPSIVRIVWVSIGSVLLAMLGTPLAAPWVVRTLSLADVPPGVLQLAVGAILGGFAQPIAGIIHRRLMARFDPTPAKEPGNG